MMLTDQQLEEFIFYAEGGNRSPAYDDKQPWKELQPGDEIVGTLTVGPGFTKRRDGSPVQIGDTMSDQEAFERLREYIAEEIEPVLEELIHVPVATSLANALGSLVFNFGATEVYNWRLWGRINAGESPLAIIREWVDGTFSSKGEPMLGLWRRRHKEILMAFGQDWRAGDNVSWEDQPDDVLRVMGWDGSMPKPAPVVDSALFEDPDLQIPHPGAKDMTREKGADPTPATPVTMDDAQFLSAEAAGYEGTYAEFMSHRTVVTARNAIEAPKVDTKNEPKPIEDSETGRGIAKKVSGKDDAWIGAAIGGASTIAGTASGISKDVSTITKNTQTAIGGATLHQLMIVGLIIGGVLLVYGLWKMHRGEQIAKEGRAKATQLKV